MDLAVSDANVLIHLAKLDQLELLKELFSNILISDIIYSESVTLGKLSNKKDSFILEDYIQKGLIIVKEVPTEEIKTIMNKYNIHDGESSVIALAKKNDINYCLTNEIKVRKAIKSEGFKVVGTLGIILRAFNSGKISKKDSLSILNQIQINLKEYRFHPKLVDKIIEEVNQKNFSTNLKR